MVFLGYDQGSFAAELQKLGISTMTLSPHEPNVFKSGLLDG